MQSSNSSSLSAVHGSHDVKGQVPRSDLTLTASISRESVAFVSQEDLNTVAVNARLRCPESRNWINSKAENQTHSAVLLLQSAGAGPIFIAAWKSLATALSSLSERSRQVLFLDDFYSNHVLASTPTERGAVLMLLYAQRENLATPAQEKLKSMVTAHLRDCLTMLPLANGTPECQCSLIDAAHAFIVDKHPAEDRKAIVLLLAKICCDLEPAAIRTQVAMCLLIEERHFTGDISVHESIDRMYRHCACDVLHELQNLDGRPDIQQCILGATAALLNQPDLPGESKLQMIQALTIATSGTKAKSHHIPIALLLDDQLNQLLSCLEGDPQQTQRYHMIKILAAVFPCIRHSATMRSRVLDSLMPWIGNLVREVPLFKSDSALQHAVLEVVQCLRTRLAAPHPAPAADARFELASALANAFMARTAMSGAMAKERSALVDDAMRAQSIPSGPRFSCARNCIDLQTVIADEDANEVAISHTRTAKIITFHDKDFRVKNIKYGNARAAEEVAMAKFYALTGLDCPNSAIAMHGNHLFTFDPASRRDYHDHADHPHDFALVASEIIPDFSDLGHCMLEKDIMRPLIRGTWGAIGAARYDKSVADYAAAKKREKDLNALSSVDSDENSPVTVEKQRARSCQLKALVRIYNLLPDHLRQETMKSYCASRLIANWDFVNYAWYNVGFHDRSKDSSAWRMATVDFGNSGTMGFGGLQKPESKARANERARPSDPQRPNEIRDGDVRFDGTIAASRTGVGMLPRARPVVPLIQSMIQAESRIAEASGDAFRVPTHEMASLSPAFEVGFRLSLIPDAAFHQVALQNWPEGAAPFQAYDTDTLHLTATELADIMIHRRDALLDQFTPREFARWKLGNPAKAEAAYDEVSAAVAALTGLHTKPFVLSTNTSTDIDGQLERARSCSAPPSYRRYMP